MGRYKRYKIAIWVLLVLVIVESIFLIYLWVRRPKEIPRIPLAKVMGKIAIVIDDWGYNLNNLEILDEIKYPLTVSVLPNLTYSRNIAEESHKRGYQIILHLPMEPYEKFKLEQNTIMTSMDESTIKDILNRALENIPHAAGVSNHMGSRATVDLKTMKVVFDELKKRRLYFLDSLVSNKSICSVLADKMNLHFAKRDIFLDNIDEPEYIKKQIYKLKSRARAYGQAVGIGHDRKGTLEVLKEIMPGLEKEGYKFVFVSELVK